MFMSEGKILKSQDAMFMSVDVNKAIYDYISTPDYVFFGESSEAMKELVRLQEKPALTNNGRHSSSEALSVFIKKGIPLKSDGSHSVLLTVLNDLGVNERDKQESLISYLTPLSVEWKRQSKSTGPNLLHIIDKIVRIAIQANLPETPWALIKYLDGYNQQFSYLPTHYPSKYIDKVIALADVSCLEAKINCYIYLGWLEETQRIEDNSDMLNAIESRQHVTIEKCLIKVVEILKEDRYYILKLPANRDNFAKLMFEKIVENADQALESLNKLSDHVCRDYRDFIVPVFQAGDTLDFLRLYSEQPQKTICALLLLRKFNRSGTEVALSHVNLIIDNLSNLNFTPQEINKFSGSLSTGCTLIDFVNEFRSYVNDSSDALSDASHSSLFAPPTPQQDTLIAEGVQEAEQTNVTADERDPAAAQPEGISGADLR